MKRYYLKQGFDFDSMEESKDGEYYSVLEVDKKIKELQEKLGISENCGHEWHWSPRLKLWMCANCPETKRGEGT